MDARRAGPVARRRRQRPRGPARRRRLPPGADGGGDGRAARDLDLGEPEGEPASTAEYRAVAEAVDFGAGAVGAHARTWRAATGGRSASWARSRTATRGGARARRAGGTPPAGHRPRAARARAADAPAHVVLGPTPDSIPFYRRLGFELRPALKDRCYYLPVEQEGRDHGARLGRRLVVFEYGRLSRCPRWISVAEPPPSRLIASRAPNEIIRRASSARSSPAWTPVRRPSQQTASSSSSPTPSAQRGWRSAVMSESNCAEPAEKPSRVLAVHQRAPVADEQRAGLDEIAAVREAPARREPDRPVDVHARAPLGPLGLDRLELDRARRRAAPRRAAGRGRARRTPRRAPRQRPRRGTSGRAAPARGTASPTCASPRAGDGRGRRSCRRRRECGTGSARRRSGPAKA